MYIYIKRCLDIAASIIALIVSAPLLFTISVLIKVDSEGPIFYCGERVGRFGKPFKILKFRTMVVNAEKLGPSSTKEDDPRIRKIGMLLRELKLDELPQIFNILMGDMSLVGPRPQVLWAVETYSEEERKIILSVRPGITDYASIKFCNEGAILKGSADPDRDYMEKIHPEKTRLAMQYVKDRSFKIDLKILYETLLTLIKKRDVYGKKELAS
jgi:lipopolysaccharide/colanic/teichoic acid biosynthesis glycosyltransferase